MRLLRHAASGGMLVFGVATAILGAALPLLSARAHFNLAAAGVLFLTLNAAIAACSLALGPLVDRHGTKPALVAGPLLVGAALFVTGAAGDLLTLLAAALLLGLGGGCLNVATNTLTADLFPASRLKNAELNRLGIFFGLGALMVPLGLGALLIRWGLSPVLWLVAAVCIAAGIYAVPLHFPSPKHLGQVDILRSTRLLKDPAIAATALLLFCQSGNEMILSGFATTYLTRFTTIEYASWALSGMWVAVILTRAVLATLAIRFSGRAILSVSAALTLAGSLALLAAPNFATATAALMFTGASMAGIFPTMLGIVGARYSSQSGAVFGIVLAVARAGAMLLPWFAGMLAAQYGAIAAMALGTIAAGGILILHITDRTNRMG